MPHLFRLLLVPVLGVLAADKVSVNLEVMKPEVIQQRLETVQRDLRGRRETLERLFKEAGCVNLSTQPVPRSKEPNVICALPAPNEGARTIVVGGHFDFAETGVGAVDDWSGASLLPSLYQSLANHPRRHRFVFVGFAAEEDGLRGSAEYVKKLSKPERGQTAAMVNLECLGLAPPAIWEMRADKRLLAAYITVAGSLGQQPMAIDLDKVGTDDSDPFLFAKIPVITIHSVTQATLPILHSANDNLKAIDAKHYYDAYRLASVYLAYIDSTID